MQLTSVLALFAATSTAAALPTKPVAARQNELSDVVDQAQAIADQIANLDVDQIEATLKAALGEAVAKIEEQLDGSLAGRIQEILDNGVPPETVAKLLAAIDKIREGVDLEAVNAWIKEQTQGAIQSVEAALGIDNLEEILQNAAQKRQIVTLYEALDKLNNGVPIEEVNAWLSEATNGAQTDLVKALGADSVDELIEDKQKRDVSVFFEAAERLKKGESLESVNKWVWKKTKGGVRDILKALGVESVDELLNENSKRQVAVIYQAIEKLRNGESLESVNKFLYNETSGKVKDILKALGVDSVEEALGSDKQKRETNIFYEAAKKLANGESVESVNAWVAKKTEGDVKDILAKLGVDSVQELLQKFGLVKAETPAKRQISVMWQAMEKVRNGEDIKVVNKWLSEKTDGRITDLLKTLGVDSVDDLMD